KKGGAKGLMRLKYVNGALDGQVAKYLPADAAGRLGLREGELALFVAGPDRISSPSLDRVRQEVAKRLNLADENDRRFLWVTDFPLLERDPDTGALVAVHHPFTEPMRGDIPLHET